MEDPLRVDEADAVIQPVGGVCSTFRSCSFSVFLCACACLVAQSCPTLCDPMDCSRLLCPWDSSGKNTGVGCQALLQGIFQIQGSNHPSFPPASPALQAGSLPLSHQGSPKYFIPSLRSTLTVPSFTSMKRKHSQCIRIGGQSVEQNVCPALTSPRPQSRMEEEAAGSLAWR